MLDASNGRTSRLKRQASAPVKNLLNESCDFARYPIRVIATVKRNIAGDRHPGHFFILVLVLLGIARIFRIDGLVVIEIDRTALDDDVATVCHVSFSFYAGLGLRFT